MSMFNRPSKMQSDDIDSLGYAKLSDVMGSPSAPAMGRPEPTDQDQITPSEVGQDAAGQDTPAQIVASLQHFQTLQRAKNSWDL
jgi:hypothetical protein